MLGSEMIARRKKQRHAWRKFLNESPPNYCLTLTFSPSMSFERASREVDRFHKRMLRELLGRQYYKKHNQPFGIAFTEYASTQFRVSKLGAPHFHILYWVPEHLETTLKTLDSGLLWLQLNMASNRSAYLDEITQKQARTINYVTKDFAVAPLDHEFIILGESERYTTD